MQTGKPFVQDKKSGDVSDETLEPSITFVVPAIFREAHPL